jgi:hypothetical protein
MEQNINMNEIYNNLVETGFYNNISLDICGEKKPDDSISIPLECNNRLDGISKIKDLGDFEIYISPCRVGRNSIYCPKEVIRKGSDCELKDTDITCPLCLVIDESKVTPCEQLTHLLRFKYPLSPDFILIPNAYPYLEKQFLITTPVHAGQMETLNDENKVAQLFNIFLRILNVNEDVVFFNGICGNSLLHFHCQYTTSSLPLFRRLPPTFDGYYEHNLFRGLVVIASDPVQIIEVIDKINRLRFTYNFVCRKINKITLQFVFYIRFCDYEHFKNLNFGSTELSGIVCGNTPPTYDLNDIEEYLELTHNRNNYIHFMTENKRGGRRTMRNKTRKNRNRKTKYLKKHYSKSKRSKKYPRKR